VKQGMNSGPGKQLWLPLRVEGELGMCDLTLENPTDQQEMMERIIAPGNLRAAYRRVKSNKGAPGIDGMRVEELAGHLRQHWPMIREQLLCGTYRPAPVRRHEIEKTGGGIRILGIPTVLDRLIQQAILQVLQPEWDPTFSESSFGFRPKRSAHQAVERAQSYYRAGCHWVVDLDLEKFFDRVNHDKLMVLVCERVRDWRVRRLIRCYLKAGMMSGELCMPREEGTPQGGPLSPLLANLLLDRLDKELEQRKLRFARFADDCNIYVGSRRAGERVMASITRFLGRRLKLKVNEAKSAVAKPRERSFLGFSLGKGGRVLLSKKAEKTLQGTHRGTHEPNARTQSAVHHPRSAPLHARLESILRFCTGSEPSERVELLDHAAAPLLPLETVGQSGVSRTEETRRDTRFGMEHLQISTRPLAYQHEPSALLRVAHALFCGTGTSAIAC
jgi:RNA-directed DNA polymerase